MKYRYMCRIRPDTAVISFLEKKNIKYEIAFAITDTLIFDLYSDMEEHEHILEYIKSKPGSLITKLSVFSKQEMEDANWYLMEVTRMGIDTRKPDFTYDAKCPYTTSYGMQKHHHIDQVNPFVSKKIPKWKNRSHFCSTETGFVTKIFCSDYAKEKIIQSGVTGVDFMPVLKSDLKTENPDISQLVFKNKLPLDAYTFIGNYTEDICPFCGRINYIFEELNCDNIRLNTNVIPKDVDVFGSEIILGEGFGDEPIVVSKKFYNLITKEINENPGHLCWYPIA